MSGTRGLSPDPNFVPRPPSGKFHNHGPAPERPAQVEVRPQNELLPNGIAPKAAPSETPWDALVREDPAQAMRVKGPSMGEQPLLEIPNGRIMSVWAPEMRSDVVQQALDADPLGAAATEAIAMQKNKAALTSLMSDMRQGKQVTSKPTAPGELTARKWDIASADGKNVTRVEIPGGIVADAVATHAPTITKQNEAGFNMSPMVEISQINLEGQTYTAVKVSSVSTMPEGKQFDPNNTKDSFFTRAKDVWGATVDNMRNGLKHFAAGVDRTATTTVVYNDKGERVAAKNADGWIFGH